MYVSVSIHISFLIFLYTHFLSIFSGSFCFFPVLGFCFILSILFYYFCYFDQMPVYILTIEKKCGFGL